MITLSQAYQQAQRLNLIRINPCTGVEVPKKRARQAVAFTVDEQKQFLENCSGKNTFENLFIFAFHTGMRLGEMLALTWSDIDIDNRIATVSKNISVVNDYVNPDKKQKTIITDTKTESGMREIPLSEAAFQAICRQKENNTLHSPIVFYSTAGTPLMKRNIYRAFHQALANSKITSHVTIHSMRHSFATRLLEKGADIKTVSKLLGHKSIQITLDIYSHVSADLKRETIALLD